MTGYLLPAAHAANCAASAASAESGAGTGGGQRASAARSGGHDAPRSQDGIRWGDVTRHGCRIKGVTGTTRYRLVPIAS